MLLYTEEGPTVINTIHVASVQIIPAIKPGTNELDHFEIHFIVSGGKIVHIVNQKYTKELTKYFTNPTSVKKISRALMEVWSEIAAEPSPHVAIPIDTIIERILEKTK